MTGRPAVIIEKQNNGTAPAAAADGAVAGGGNVATASFSNAATVTQVRNASP